MIEVDTLGMAAGCFCPSEGVVVTFLLISELEKEIVSLDQKVL